MKKSLLLSVVASTMIMAGGVSTPPATAQSNGTFAEALKKWYIYSKLKNILF